MLDLKEIRNKIDQIDSQMVKLFEERMRLCEDVAAYKIENGKKVLDPVREEEKLKTIEAMVTDEKNIHGINELFTQIMANSRKMQYRMLEENGFTLREDISIIDRIDCSNSKVVYQGVEGAYSYIAMKQYFGNNVDNFHVETWKEAMEAIKDGRADYAVLPIENSTAGIVGDVYDLLQEYDNYIVAETFVNIEHALLGIKGSSIEDIDVVYSHPQGLMQCQRYIDNHGWQAVGQLNTAMSAKKVLMDNNRHHAAIASVEAAECFGLDVLAKAINDIDCNATRFIIVSPKRSFVKAANKMSICFETNDKAGKLYDLLSHLIYNGLNMTKIESRPIIDKPWEFRFFVDFEGNIEDTEVITAMHGIQEEANYIKLLGNY